MHKAVRDLLIKAGLDIEYDLADPDVLETVRDFLVNYQEPSENEEDDVEFGAKIIASAATNQQPVRRNVVKKVDQERKK